MTKDTTKAITIWDHLNNIMFEKGPFLGDEGWNITMINRFISMDEDYCELVSILQKNLRPYSYISNAHMYEIYRELIPKQKKWFKYIKNANKQTYDENEVESISVYFEISSKEAKEYTKILDKEEIKHIKLITGNA